jgi:hypothetical protein
MRRATVFWSICLTILGCRDFPLESGDPRAEGPIRAALAPSMSAPTLSCTRSWANGVDGDWDDPGSWSPAGVPDSADAVCIKATGTYTVLVEDTIMITNLQLGGAGAAVTLQTDPSALPHFFVYDTLSLIAGSTLAVMTAATAGYVGTLFVNDGSLVFSGGNNGFYAQELVNNGLLRLDAFAWLILPNFEHNGTIQVNARSCFCNSVEYPTYDFRGGQVTGSQQLEFDGGGGRLHWHGTRFDALATDPARSVVRVILLDTIRIGLGASGRLTANSRWSETHVVGVIPNNVHLQLLDSLGTGFWLSERTLNMGTLEVVANPGFGDIELNLSYFENRGTVDVKGGGVVRINADTIVNRSTITIDGTAKLLSGVFRNRDRVAVANGAELEIFGSTITRPNSPVFQADSGSVLTGALHLRKGRVTGTGTLGFLQSFGGRIEPGAPIGTLRTGSVVLDPATELTVEVSDTKPGKYDQLAITGSMMYDGTLRVLNSGPLTTPACGMTVPIVTVSWISTGVFDTVVDSQAATLRGWRPHYAANVLQLAGYVPSNGITFSPAQLALSEGGPARSYFACLGTQTPTASVTVNATPALAQLQPIPSFVFALSNWQLPQTISVRALDDAIVEPPLTDTIRHTLMSTDGYYQGKTAALRAAIVDNDGSSDLALTFVQQIEARPLGTDFTITLRARNLGPTISTGSTLTIPALTGLELVAASGAPCSVNGSGAVTCTLPGLAVGAQIDFALTLRGTIVGEHSNTLTLTGQQADPATANNTLSYTVRIT